MIFCFGDLNIDGDLLIDDYEYWPLLFVQGNLTCKNLLKGGMPLIVLGDIKTTYFIGEYNDGPLRVGGKLDGAGYIPRVKDQGGIAGHVITGGYTCPAFNAAKDPGRSALAQVFKADALEKGWLDSSKVRALGRAGKSIWLGPEQTASQIANLISNQQTAEVVRPEKLALSGGLDPTSLGELVAVNEINTEIFKLIEEKIAFDPDKNSYPLSFSEPVRFQLQAYPNEKVLVLPNNCTLTGLLKLDWQEHWVQQDSDEEDEWREVLSASVFASEDEDYPEVDLIYAAQKAGMKLFI